MKSKINYHMIDYVINISASADEFKKIEFEPITKKFVEDLIYTYDCLLADNKIGEGVDIETNGNNINILLNMFDNKNSLLYKSIESCRNNYNNFKDLNNYMFKLGACNDVLIGLEKVEESEE